MRWSQIGMWSWGVITVTLAIAVLIIVGVGGYHMDASGTVVGLGRMGGIYKAISECDSLVAGIPGFSGLAWAHFFKAVGEKA